MESFLNSYDYFKVRVFFVDKVFSPEEIIPVVNTVERDMFVTFSDEMGTRGSVTLASYEVKTDESIWPYEDIIK